MTQPDGIHTIPVPHGWSVEQAWEAIQRGTPMQIMRGSWANIEVKDGKMVKVHA